MARILCTGNLTLDIVNTVDHYPVEDEELRASGQLIASGGNAANTALVLAQLHQDAYLASTIANDQNGSWLKNHLRDQGVNVDHVRQYKGDSPTSFITLNQTNGSRTIVHHRELPELSPTDFAHIALERIDWFHFEGRNVEALAINVALTLEKRIDQPISLELEKERPGLEQIAKMADVLMISRAYAVSQGFESPDRFLLEKQKQFPHSLLSLSWGAEGAWFCDPKVSPTHVPAKPIAQVVDTVGAGDTYNAGLINALASGQPFDEAVNFASRLAEEKIQHQGLLFLAKP